MNKKTIESHPWGCPEKCLYRAKKRGACKSCAERGKLTALVYQGPSADYETGNPNGWRQRP